MEELQGKGREEEEEEEEEERVWSWGAGTDGQLGIGASHDCHLPHPLPTFHRHSISRIACGGAHAIALLTGGRVLSWGRGNCGQLGHGNLGNCLNPKPIDFFESIGISITHVSAGWNHSGFVSDMGELFTCGDGSFGQLGHGDNQSQSSPIKVSFFDSKHVVQVECGMRHSLTLSKGTLGVSIHGFGLGRRGQLGISVDRSSRVFAIPQAIGGLEGLEIATICANGDHSAALSDEPSTVGLSFLFDKNLKSSTSLLILIDVPAILASANGHLYIWGRGLGGALDAYHPQLVQLPLKFSQVSLGWSHALLLTDDGEVFMLGGSHHGMLSNPEQTSHERQPSIHCTTSASSSHEISSAMLTPARVPGLDGKKVVEVAAGAEHSALVTDDGAVMTWGWGEHGQLGLGHTTDQTRPLVVSLVEEEKMVNYGSFKVYCGSGFTVAVGRFNPSSQTGKGSVKGPKSASIAGDVSKMVAGAPHVLNPCHQKTGPRFLLDPFTTSTTVFKPNLLRPRKSLRRTLYREDHFQTFNAHSSENEVSE
ncbi:hypothetical protein ACLOJK_033622 [Asimina triloba]